MDALPAERPEGDNRISGNTVIPPATVSPSRSLRLLQAAFVAAVVAFAWLRFSENTVDNDLWGHVLYGQRAWVRGGLEYTDVLSWTAAGRPWINHELLAELVMGGVHRIGGGTGLWLLMIGFAIVTVGLALRAGRGTGGAQGWIALTLFAVSINTIATGYAVRPQLFTMLALVLLLLILRRIAHGSAAWAIAVPCLFGLWVNSHGGYIAGLVVVGTSACAAAAQSRFTARGSARPVIPWLILPVLALAGALCNPWGWRLLAWTAGSILLPRPGIGEWHPLGFSPPGLALIAIILVSATGWYFSRRAHRWWEMAALIVLAAMALRSQRHTPLFALANLILTPHHLAGALERLAPRCRSLVRLALRPVVQWPVAAMLGANAALTFGQSLSAPRVHPFTLEIERDVFPEAAAAFIQEHGLAGNTITFFDWGQQALWRLPNNPVSFDGRLDTVYPVAVMDAHWRLYAGKDPGPALELERADIALLPNFSPGADWLRAAGWTTVYRDSLAEVQLRRPQSYPNLLDRIPGHHFPFFAKLSATSGRIPFPSDLPVLSTPAAPR